MRLYGAERTQERNDVLGHPANRPVALVSRGNVSRPTDSLRRDLHRVESLRVVGPRYESPYLIGSAVSGLRPDAPVHGVSAGSVVTGEESRIAWDESFSDLDEIARGVELDGPALSKPSLETAKRFLSVFAARGLRAPVVGEVTGRGVSIEFPGEFPEAGAGTRLTFIIEGDGSITYYELIEGRRWRGRFPNLSSMLPVVWPSSFHRSGLLPPARPGPRRRTAGDRSPSGRGAERRPPRPEGTEERDSIGDGHAREPAQAASFRERPVDRRS